MNDDYGKSVIQLIPADGWKSLYYLPDYGIYELPLACFALSTNQECRQVFGMGPIYQGESIIDLPEECDEFVAYIGPGKTAIDLIELLEERRSKDPSGQQVKWPWE